MGRRDPCSPHPLTPHYLRHCDVSSEVSVAAPMRIWRVRFAGTAAGNGRYMQIRRPLAGLFVALTLFGGGATLAGCGDPTSSNTGTPKDTASTTPTQSADNSVPDNSNREPSSPNTENGAGGNG